MIVAVIVLAIIAIVAIGAAIAPTPTIGEDVVQIPSGIATLFTSATFGLLLIGAIIGVLTLVVSIYGREWLENTIERRANEKIEELKIELNAMTAGYVGFIFGKLYHIDRAKHRDLVDPSITYSRTAMDMFPQGHEKRNTAINNFAFFCSLRGDARDGEICVEYGKYLKRRYSSDRDTDYLTTYASIVATYHRLFDDPQKAIAEAKDLMREVMDDPTTSDHDKQNAHEKLQRLEDVSQLSLALGA